MIIPTAAPKGAREEHAMTADQSLFSNQQKSQMGWRMPALKVHNILHLQCQWCHTIFYPEASAQIQTAGMNPSTLDPA